MGVINFDGIIGKGNNYITDNIFCIKHPTNCLITGKSNSGKTNILLNRDYEFFNEKNNILL